MTRPIPRRTVVLAAVLPAALLLGACGTPRDTLYTLDPVIERSAPEPLPRYVVEVAAVTVPDLVDRPQFVVRDSANRVTLLEQQRWASPLSAQVLLTVAENLGRLLPEARVKPTGEAAPGDVGWRVALDIERFDLLPDQGVALVAQWSARRIADGQLRTGRVDLTEPAGPGYEALAAASGRALGPLSRQIADAIRAGQAAPAR